MQMHKHLDGSLRCRVSMRDEQHFNRRRFLCNHLKFIKPSGI